MIFLLSYSGFWKFILISRLFIDPSNIFKPISYFYNSSMMLHIDIDYPCDVTPSIRSSTS